VTSHEQYNGYGTNGRSWESPTGNLYASIILPLNIVDSRHIGQLSMATSMAVANAVKRHFGVTDVVVKWPNDVLVGGKKIAGILIEIEKEFAVVGIGVNVANAPSTGQLTTCLMEHYHPKILQGTSASTTTNATVNATVNDVMAAILSELDYAYYQLHNGNFQAIKLCWTSLCPDFGTFIKKDNFSGFFVDIGEDGEMMLKNQTKTPENLEKIFSHRQFSFFEKR
jgi:BirA family biotin operon repressor/biotin-[acetyl-CoA-carboxylase] ligase